MKALLIAALFAVAGLAHAELTCYNLNDNTNIATWTVGQPRDAFDNLDGDENLTCFAQGKELAYIQQHFSGLRMRTLPSVRDVQYPQRSPTYVYWDGDDALFIVENL